MLLFVVGILFWIAGVSGVAGTLSGKPDALIEDSAGKVVKRGIYTTGARGEVLRYDIRSEETGEMLHSEIPVYDSSGEMALTRVYDGKGKLKALIVNTEAGWVKLDANGNPLSEERFRKVYSSDYENPESSE